MKPSWLVDSENIVCDRDLDDCGAGEVALERRWLGAALDEDVRVGGVRRSDGEHLVVAVVGEREVLGVLDRERVGGWGRWSGAAVVGAGDAASARPVAAQERCRAPGLVGT